MPAAMQRRWWAGFLLLFFFFFKTGIERIQRDKSNETLVSHGAIKMDTNLHNAYAWEMHSPVGKHGKN